jgi:DNA-binding Lrp family transcriptional regulator
VVCSELELVGKVGVQPKIDAIDAKILRTLLLESRTSFTDLAGECKITVAAVRMRYKRLWKEGVINGEKMLVNPHCLGYRHIVDLGIACAVEDEKDVAQFLEGNPCISELVSPYERYSFFGKVALRDLKGLHQIIEEFESFSKIKHVDAFIWNEAVNVEYPENLVLKPLSIEKKPQPKLGVSSPDSAVVEIDETDRQIAEILTSNSRTPFKTIATQLGLSAKTVIQRYKRLRENLLPVSSITLDLSKLGFQALANVYLKVSNRSKMQELYTNLLEIPNLVVIIRLIDNSDLYCAIFLQNFQEIFEANQKLRRISGVEEVKFVLVPLPPAWPLNLFPALLEGNEIRPKYWPTR